MCMTFVIGKNASRTGRVIIGHNEDDAGHTVVRHGYVPAKDWPEGSLVPAEEGRARIPQASHTFGYHWSELAGPEGGYPWGDGFLNECGVCVTSNNCSFSKEDKPDLTDGGMAYNLRRVTAERAGSAREALMVMIDMVETWGYAPSGRCYFAADKDEAFMLQIVSGKRWMAVRVPDDHVAVMPNHYTFRGLDEYEECWCSPDLVDYAFERGWYDPARDGVFEFARTFQHENTFRAPRNVMRHVRALERLTGKAWDIEKEGLPCSVRVSRKLGAKDVMDLLTDHYENTPGDLRTGPGRSPHDSANCRICGADTSESFVCEFHEDAKLTTMWTAFGRPCELPYIPLHPLTGLPEEIATMPDPEKAMAEHLLPNPHLTDRTGSVWQRLHDFSNAAELVYSDVIGEISRVKAQLYAEFAFGNEESLRHPETLIAADALRVKRAVEAYESIRLPSAQILTLQPVKAEKGEEMVLRFAAKSKPVMESLRLGVCRVMDHEKQYARALRLTEAEPGVYEAAFGIDSMQEFSAKGVHESFLGGADEGGTTFVSMVMLDVQQGGKNL